MRKATKKIIAGACAVVMMASCFAACSGNTEDNTTTAAPDSSSSVQAEESSSESQAASGESQAPSSNGVTKPADKAAAVKVFNDAVAKTPVKKADMQRKWVSGKVKVVNLDLATVDKNIPTMFEEGSGALSGDAAKLKNLSANDVKSFTASETATDVKVTINLNDATLNSKATAGTKGYQYFITYKDATQIAMTIGTKLGGEGFTLAFDEASVKLELSAGKIEVTIDKATGKFKSVKYTMAETVSGKVETSALPVKAPAEIKGTGTVTYNF